jgi:hypothetical protein
MHRQTRTSLDRVPCSVFRVPCDFDIEFDVHDRVLKPHGELDMLTSPILLAAAKAFTWEIPGDMNVDQLLDVARQTLQQVQELNKKIPGAPIFPAAATTAGR